MNGNPYFPEIKKNFGFGCMRLPMNGSEVDVAQCCRMTDAFLDAGFNYFDTAHGYLGGLSEKAVKACLTSRYPRDRYILTDKLSGSFFRTEADIRPYFQTMLDCCGVEYFDFFLMHSQHARNYGHFKECRAYEIASELKEEGKVHHVGMSFHDSAEVLEQILREQKGVEFVQLQFNYLDYEDPTVQSRRCYEVCRRYGKPVIVMEPVRGGSLAALPDQAEQLIAGMHGDSPAVTAIRYAAGFEGICMVLSGMSSMEQMEENLSAMKEFSPLNEKEKAVLSQVASIIHETPTVPCTACRYCTDGCPKHINIPEFMRAENKARRFRTSLAERDFQSAAEGGGKPSDCIGCGKCEKICPQHIRIREELKQISRRFES